MSNKEKRKKKKKRMPALYILPEILFVIWKYRRADLRRSLKRFVNEIYDRISTDFNCITFKVVAKLMDICNNIEDTLPDGFVAF